MEKKVSLSNIASFIEGNTKMFLKDLGFQPEHIKEQIAYRLMVCKDDCGVYGYCKHCNCPLPDKMYVKKSCNNGELFPDLMSRNEWTKFKDKHGIK